MALQWTLPALARDRYERENSPIIYPPAASRNQAIAIGDSPKTLPVSQNSMKEQEPEQTREVKPGLPGRGEVRRAARKALLQIATILPVLCGVVLLLGLLRAGLPDTVLFAAFSGNDLLDALSGAGIGSVFTGNPINSYVIGGQLLDGGISTIAVAAFVVTWVTVGVAQLPAEAVALGTRFALSRNLLAFLLSLPIAAATAAFVAFTGGMG